MAGELDLTEPFQIAQASPVPRPAPVVRPGEERRTPSSGKKKPTENPFTKYFEQPAQEAAPAAPKDEPGKTVDSNPFRQFFPDAAAIADGVKPASAATLDITGPFEDVRARIAALPEKDRAAALARWADMHVAKDREGGVGQAVMDYARRAAEGAVGGWGDRAGAQIASMVNPLSYDENLALGQALTRAAHKATDQTVVGHIPKFNLPLVGEVGGDVSTGDLAGLAGGAALFSRMPTLPLARALPYLKDAPAALLSRMVDYGATGAIAGGAIGAGSGNTTEERVDNAKRGAAMGGGLGAAIPPIGRAIGGVAGRVRDAVAPLPTELQPFHRGAVDRMAAAFEADGAPANTAQYGAEGMLADMGSNLRDKAGALVATPGPQKQIIADAILDRRLGARGRIAAEADASLGPAQNLVALEERVTGQAQQRAEPHYDAFYNTPIQPTPRLQAFLDFAEQNGIVRAADEAMAREAILTGRQPSPNMRLDFIKRQFDRMAKWSETPAAGLDRHAAGQYRQMARAFRDEVDRILSPNDPAQSPWARARHESGEGLQFAEGLEEGRNAFSKATHPDQMAADLRSASAPYEAGYVAGGRGQIRDIMGNAGAAYGPNGDIAALKNLNAEYAQQKFAHLVGPERAASLGGRLRAEAEFNRTYDDALRNSKTETRRSSKENIPNTEAGPGGKLDLSPGGIAGRLISKIVDTTTGGVITERNLRIVKDMADMMVAQGVRREAIADGLRQYIVRTGVTGQVRGRIDRLITHLLRGVGTGATNDAIERRRAEQRP